MTIDLQNYVPALSKWYSDCLESIMRTQVERAFGKVLAELIFDYKWYFLFYVNKIQFEVKEMRDSNLSLDFRQFVTLLVDGKIIDAEVFDYTGGSLWLTS